MQHSARPSFSFLKKKRKKLGACFHRLVFITTCLRKGDKSRLRGNNGEDGILKFPISSRKRSPDLSICLFCFALVLGRLGSEVLREHSVFDQLYWYMGGGMVVSTFSSFL